MRRFTAILIFLGVVCSAMAQINVAPGMRMPDVDADWVKPLRRVCPGKDSKVMDIVVFSDVNNPEFVQTLRYLESLESKYRRMNKKNWILKVRVVVPNDKSVLERVVKFAEPSFSVSITTVSPTFAPTLFLALNSMLDAPFGKRHIPHLLHSSFFSTFTVALPFSIFTTTPCSLILLIF